MKFLSLSPQKPWIARSKKKDEAYIGNTKVRPSWNRLSALRFYGARTSDRKIGLKKLWIFVTDTTCLRHKTPASTSPKADADCADGRTRSAQPGIRQEISAKGRSNICRLAVTTKRKPRCRYLQRGFCEVWSEAHYSLIIWYLRYFTLLDSWI